jgi:hypothetical protein
VRCLLGAAVFALSVANLNASVMFTDNFDSYTPPSGSSTPLGAPWVQQGAATVQVYDWSGGSASPPNVLGYTGYSYPNAVVSRPTGASADDTNVKLSAYFNGELSASMAKMALGPNAGPGSDDWRGTDSKGSLNLSWCCGYGVELYYVHNDGSLAYYDYGGTVKQTGKVNFRFVAPQASGAQTVAVDWKLAADSTWTNIANIPVDSSFKADYIGIDLIKAGASWADDVHFESVPEPSSFMLVVSSLVGLMAYAWRKRK